MDIDLSGGGGGGGAAAAAAAAAAAPVTSLADDSSEWTLRVSWEDIKKVQVLVEKCLQVHMTQSEIVAALQVQANVSPELTMLVWRKLEEQNADFFYAYDIRLRLKDQITAFNYLVEQQCELLRKISKE